MILSSRRGSWTEKATAWQSTEAGEYRNIYSSLGNGECSAKKVPYRIAQKGARKTQYRIIYQHREEYEVKAMCTFFGVSRAAYYKWVKRSVEPDKETERKALVQEVWLKSRETPSIIVTAILFNLSCNGGFRYAILQISTPSSFFISLRRMPCR